MSHRVGPGATHRVRRAWIGWWVALLATHLAGCVTADGVLRADGTATLALTYAAHPGSTEAMHRERLTAPGVTVESLSIGSDHKVSAKLLVTDLAAIGKTALLKDVTVTASKEGEARTLTIGVKVKPPPRKPEDKSLPGPSIRVTLPGKILDATKPGVVDGATVKWTFPLADWLERTDWQLTARYQPSEATPPATQPEAPAAKPE